MRMHVCVCVCVVGCEEDVLKRREDRRVRWWKKRVQEETKACMLHVHIHVLQSTPGDCFHLHVPVHESGLANGSQVSSSTYMYVPPMLSEVG